MFGLCSSPSCKVNADCAATLLCIQETCTRRCESTAQCSGNQSCIRGICGAPPAHCSHNADCGNGFHCVAPPGHPHKPHVCKPASARGH
jgi:hypothetical protein